VNVFLVGVRTVAEQEFRLRIRAGRWRWLLAAWFGSLAAFLVLMRLALDGPGINDDDPYGTAMYGSLMLLVLGLGMLIVPALTAQSVNGDRERGTLATLQITRLTAGQIAVGKLVAAWGTSLVFLALTVPLVLWCLVEGGVHTGRLVVTMLVVALLLGVMCAVAQALSALFTRSTTSAVMSYLVVFTLSIGTLIVFGLATAMTQETVTRSMPGGPVDPSSNSTAFESHVYTTTQTRQDRVWWLLAPNPFVVLADAAPSTPPRIDPVTGRQLSRPFDPLGDMGDAVRSVRLPPMSMEERYGSFQEPPESKWVWPYGLAVNILLGAGALAITTMRLRTPARTLSRGLRVA
jgi:ABC-2 type transport system permease protein